MFFFIFRGHKFQNRFAVHDLIYNIPEGPSRIKFFINIRAATQTWRLTGICANIVELLRAAKPERTQEKRWVPVAFQRSGVGGGSRRSPGVGRGRIDRPFAEQVRHNTSLYPLDLPLLSL